MPSRLSRRTSWTILLVLSSLWVAATFVPMLYSVLFPAPDFQVIVHALELRGTPPPFAADTVRQVVAASGPLQRTLQVGYYTQVSATYQSNGSHKTRRTQVSYLAWFQNLPKPILLLVERRENNGVLEGYKIGEGEPMSLVRAIGLPLLALAFSFYMMRRKKSLLYDGPSPQESP